MKFILLTFFLRYKYVYFHVITPKLYIIIIHFGDFLVNIFIEMENDL